VAAHRYARAKFEEEFGIAADAGRGQLAAVLPHTRAWLALASGQLPTAEQRLATAYGEPDGEQTDTRMVAPKCSQGQGPQCSLALQLLVLAAGPESAK
jgi:hypothetical protein